MYCDCSISYYEQHYIYYKSFGYLLITEINQYGMSFKYVRKISNRVTKYIKSSIEKDNDWGKEENCIGNRIWSCAYCNAPHLQRSICRKNYTILYMKRHNNEIRQAIHIFYTKYSFDTFQEISSPFLQASSKW